MTNGVFNPGLRLAAGILLIGGTAFAQEPAPPSTRGAVEIGVRVGYALPFGHEGSTATDPDNTKLSDDVKGMLPLEIDAGYRVNPSVYVGLSFQYGFGFVNSDNSANAECGQSGTSCSSSDIRLDVNLQLHLAPGQTFDPWLGLGVGYEWLAFDVSVGGVDAGVTGSGFELANLQLGGDFVAAPNLAVGPFVGLSLGQYRTATPSGAAGSMSEDITNKSLHEWLEFGLRGAFDIGL